MLRPMEITAVIIHAIAAHLFDSTNKLPYKRPSPSQLRKLSDNLPEDMSTTWEEVPSPYPTWLYHNNCLAQDMYPMGLADVVAYWAETHIFGGVVVFDHGENETEGCQRSSTIYIQCTDTYSFSTFYLHPDAQFKVFRLSDDRIDRVLRLGIYGEPAACCPLPLRAERDAIRVFPKSAMQRHHIYRTKNDHRVRDPNSDPMRSWHPRGRMEDDPYTMEFIKKFSKGEIEFGPGKLPGPPN